MLLFLCCLFVLWSCNNVGKKNKKIWIFGLFLFPLPIISQRPTIPKSQPLPEVKGTDWYSVQQMKVPWNMGHIHHNQMKEKQFGGVKFFWLFVLFLY